MRATEASCQARRLLRARYGQLSSVDGEEILEEVKEVERIRVNGSFKERVLHRRKKVIDDDLPVIAGAFAEFRKKNKEPGA